MRALLLATLLLATLLPAGTASARCEYDSNSDYAIGNSYVHASSHRCTWSSGGTTYTQRLERYDAFLYDPYSPTGLRAAGTFLLESSETRRADGSYSVTHRTFFEKDGVAFEVSYTGSDSIEGPARCSAVARLDRSPTSGTQVRSPLLPACLPDGFLLP